ACILVSKARHQEQTRVELPAIELAGVAAKRPIEAAFFDTAGDRIALALEALAPRSDRDRALLIEIEQPIECRPAHHPGERVVPSRIGNFPHAVVRFAPSGAADIA